MLSNEPISTGQIVEKRLRLYFFEKETAEGKQVGNLEIVLWTIGLTLFLSSVLKVVQDILVRKVRS